MILDKHSIARFKDEPLLGFPHIGAKYVPGISRGHLNYRREEGALCAVCGRVATETHHLVELGMGGVQMPHNARRHYGIFPLYSPLFALCRECHKRFHSHEVTIEWAYDEGEGDCPATMALRTANSPLLFGYGRYLLTNRGGSIREIRP